MEDNQLTIIDENGNERVCEILFTHKANGKNYVVFEFLDTEEISAAIYTPEEDSEEGFLSDIETDEEWDMLDELLDSFYDSLEQSEEFEDDEDEEDEQ